MLALPEKTNHQSLKDMMALVGHPHAHHDRCWCRIPAESKPCLTPPRVENKNIDAGVGGKVGNEQRPGGHDRWLVLPQNFIAPEDKHNLVSILQFTSSVPNCYWVFSLPERKRAVFCTKVVVTLFRKHL